MTSDGKSGPLLETFAKAVKDRYENLTLLGEGGMGVTFRAFDIKLKRNVAIKVIQQKSASDARIHERFRREVLLLSRVKHPNIVTIYDMSFERRPWYFTMEYIEGLSLAKVLETKVLSEQECLSLTVKLAQSIQAVHDAGVLHRDIKPQNIMLSLEGEPTLIDFGLATGTASVDLTALTRTGNVVGTTCYLAPELLRGEKASLKTDIYQIGVCMYEAIAGRPPFDSESLLAVALGGRIKGAQPPSNAGANVSQALDQLILRTISPQAKERPKSAQELASACKDILLGTGKYVAQKRNKVKPQVVKKSGFKWAILVLVICLLFASWTFLDKTQDGASKTQEINELPQSEIMMRIDQLLSKVATQRANERDKILQSLSKAFLPLCKNMARQHPQPTISPLRSWQLLFKFGLLGSEDPLLFAPLQQQVESIKSISLALSACSSMKPGRYDKALLEAKRGLEALRTELLESSKGDWAALEYELAFVELVKAIAFHGRERTKAKLLCGQLLEAAHSFRAQYARKMGTHWIPVKDDVALTIRAVCWQAKEEGSLRPLNDLRYPLQLIINSPDIPEKKQNVYRVQLKKALADYPDVRKVITSEAPNLDGEYWALVGRYIEKGSTRYHNFRANRNKSVDLWYSLLGQSFWCFQLSVLGPDIEPLTRGHFINVCKDLIIYGSRVPQAKRTLYFAPLYVAQVALTQLSLLAKPNWHDGSISTETEINVLAYGARLFKAMRGRFPGAGKPLGWRDSKIPRRFGDWRQIKHAKEDGTVWFRALALLEGVKHKTLSQRVLLAVHRRISGDFPSAIVAYLQMEKSVAALVAGDRAYDEQNVRFFRHLLLTISEESDLMGDMTLLRKYLRLLESFLSREDLDKRQRKLLHGGLVRRQFRALKKVNKARIAAPKLTTRHIANLRRILEKAEHNELQEACYRLLKNAKK